MFRTGATISIGIGILMGPICAMGQEGKDVLGWSETRQGQIRTQTMEVGKHIDELIEEYELNGLGGDDLKALSAVRGILGTLSEQQMARVIEILGTARAADDPEKSRQLAATAVADQRSIVAQLRRLLIEFQKQQAMLDLSIRMKALAERQDANLRESVKLAKEIAGKSPSAIREEQRLATSLAQSEQQAIRDEIDPILSQLGKMAMDPENLLKDRVNEAIKEAQGLREAMEGAVEALRQGNLYNAASLEKTVRDELRDLARGVMPPRSAQDAIKEAIADLDQAMSAAEKAMNATKGAGNDQAPGIEPAMASAVDKTDQVRKDVEPLSPLLAGDLKEAMGMMQQARSELNAKKPKDALGNQAKAMESMGKTREGLEKLAEAARNEKTDEADPVARASRTRDGIENLLEKQQTLSSQLTNASNAKEQSKAQSELAKKASDLSRDVNDAEAKKSLADAAEQMSRASAQLDKNNRKSAKDAMTAAVSALGKAKMEMDQAVGAMEKASSELSELKGKRESAAELARRQDAMELSTEMSEKGKPDPSGASAQEAMAQEAKRLAERIGETPAGAKSAMERAAEEMKQASKEIEAGNNASPSQREASDSMRRAMGAMDRKMEELSRKLGKSAMDSQALDEAGKGIESLGEKAAKAKKSMEGDDSKAAGAAGELAEVSMKAGALSMTQGMPTGVSESLRQAAGALRRAAASAKSGKGEQARQAAQDASESLAQASAMMTLAQAGMPTGKADERQPSAGAGNRQDIDSAGDSTGQRNAMTGASAFLGLPARDRAAILQSTTEGRPQEYASQIEQYLRNLSDQENQK